MPEIKFDPNNARIHSEANQNAIAKALELGAGRSIVIDSEDVIIGGNGVYAEAQKAGIPVRIIDSDGSELIAIRRTDLKTADAKRKALALADNKTNDLSVFDDTKVAAIFAELEEYAENSGFTADDIAALLPDSAEEIETASEDKPEVPFSEELLEAHNYIVLFFDNSVDWLQAQTIFDIKTVKESGSKPGFDHRGVGRVINGAIALQKIMEAIAR